MSRVMPIEDRPRLARRRHLDMLLFAAVAVVLAFAVRVRADQRVELHWLPDYPAPEMCAWRTWTGLDCPACGLTRGFIRLAEGDCSAALALNRTSLLLAVAVLLQFPYRLLVLCGSSFGRRLSESPWPNAFGWLLIAALIGNWLLRLLGL
jgi:uncharacterized protein DUF2752